MRLLGLSPLLGADRNVVEAYHDRSTLFLALRVESALARAEAACGVIPESAVEPIVAACREGLYDLDALAEASLRAGTYAIPLVKRLSEEVGAIDPAAASWVHFGATSQDVLDTVLVLQLRSNILWLTGRTGFIKDRLRALAAAYRDTPMLGRTLLQPGPPITFGLKAASWLSGIERGVGRFEQAADEALVLQFGGAVGTLSALGDKGPEVARALGALLHLPVPTAPWHAQRDRLAALASAAAVLAGSVAKVARDITLLMQPEVAEVRESYGSSAGGSSTMPHKRNPVSSVAALAAYGRVPGLLASIVGGLAVEHERGAGTWQSEASTQAELMIALSATVEGVARALGGLRVDPEAMWGNIERLRGLIMAEPLSLALAPALGRGEAHALVEKLVAEAASSGRHLQEVAGADPAVGRVLEAASLDQVFNPREYLGSAGFFVDALLDDAQPGA